MKILHIQRVTGIAGSEKHLLTLLPRLKATGYDPAMLILLDRKGGGCTFYRAMQDSGIPAQMIPMRGDFDPLLIGRLVKFIKQGSYEIVHTHLIHADLYGSLAARIAGVSTIISTRHNDDAFRRFLFVQLMTRLCSRLTDHFICISENLKKFYGSTDRIPEQKMTVIHYGLDYKEMQQTRRVQREFGWHDHAPILGMVARLTPQKGHSCLLRAMPLVLREFPQTRLVLIGDGVLRDALEDLAGQLDLRKSVYFLGHREDASALMGSFDIFVHPSRWEGFGMVFLEAMAASLPVVATEAGAIPEIVVPEQTGLLVEVDDVEALAAAVCKLLANRERAQEMGAAGFRRLRERFTVQAMTERTSWVYTHCNGFNTKCL